MTKKQTPQNDDPNEHVRPEQSPGMPLVDPETIEKATDLVRERIAIYGRDIAPHIAAIRAVCEREKMPLLMDIEVSTPWDRLSRDGDGEALLRFTTMDIQPDGKSEPTLYHKLAYQALHSEDSKGASTEVDHIQEMVSFCGMLLRQEKRKLLIALIASMGDEVDVIIRDAINENKKENEKPKGKRKPKGE